MAERFTNPTPQFLDTNGDPLGSGKVHFFENLTSTPQNTYSDEPRTTPNANPVILDGDGRLPDVYLLEALYTVRLDDVNDVTIWTKDNVASVAGLNDEAATYAALKAIDVTTLTSGQTIYVESRATIGDGGEGTFYATQSNPGADNDGTFLHSDTAGWYFVRQYIGLPDITWFGPDKTGATSSAVAFANIRGLNTLFYCPTGTYQTDEQALVANQGIVGDGPGLTNIKGLAASITPLVSASAVDGCRLYGLTLDHTDVSGGTASIADFQNSDDLFIRDVEVKGSQDKGLNVLNCARYATHYVTGSDCASWMVAFDGAAGIGGRASNITGYATLNRVVAARDQTDFIYSDFSGVDCGGETLALITSSKGTVSNMLATGNTAGDGNSIDGCSEITGSNFAAYDFSGHGLSIGSGIGTASTDVHVSSIVSSGGALSESGVAITDNGSGVNNIRNSATGIIVLNAGKKTTNTYSGITLSGAQNCHVEGDVYDPAGNMNYGFRELDGGGTSANNTFDIRIHDAGQTADAAISSTTSQGTFPNRNGIAAVGDAAKTWYSATDQKTQLFNTTLTADRVITLKTGLFAYKGAEIIVSRPADGLFDLTITPDGGASLIGLNEGDWARCVHDGANWQLVEHGSSLTTTGSTLTIATAAITITGTYHKLAGEGGVADTVDTINGGVPGQRLLLQAIDGAVTITVAEGGNIKMNAVSGNLAMNGLSDVIELFYDGARALWTEIARSKNTT